MTLTPEQLLDIAKKLGVRGAARGTRSHLSLLRAVSEALEKRCEDAEAIEVLKSMLTELNVVLNLDPEVPQEVQPGEEEANVDNESAGEVEDKGGDVDMQVHKDDEEGSEDSDDDSVSEKEGYETPDPEDADQERLRVEREKNELDEKQRIDIEKKNKGLLNRKG